MTRIVVLRPEPGAGATADRARAAGLDPVVAPLFAVEPTRWSPPDPALYDALLLTSVNAVRHGGPALARYAALPAYAVGEATAAVARAAGFRVIHAGDRDAASVVARLAADARGHVLHPCGVDHLAVRGGEAIDSLPVYRSVARETLPPVACAAIEAGAIALLHSPRAAATFARLLDDARIDRARVALAAISTSAARAAGEGWRALAIAPAPHDAALLAEAARLCDEAHRWT